MRFLFISVFALLLLPPVLAGAAPLEEAVNPAYYGNSATVQAEDVKRTLEENAKKSNVNFNAQSVLITALQTSLAASIDFDNTGKTVLTGDNVQAVLNQVEDALIQIPNDVDTLVGTNGPHLGAFTGFVIPDGVSVKAALQALESHLESIDPVAAADGSYDGHGFLSAATNLPGTSTTAITHNLSTSFPAAIAVYDSTGKWITDAVIARVVDANNVSIQNESATAITGARIVVRK